MRRNKHRFAIEKAIAELDKLPKGAIHANAVRSLLNAYESSSQINSELSAEIQIYREAARARSNRKKLKVAERQQREHARAVACELRHPVPPAPR